MRNHIPFPDKDNGPVGIPRKDGHGSQQVIDLPPKKADPKDQRRVNRPKRLVEIGAVLLCDQMHGVRWHRGACHVSNRIKIPDQCIRQSSDGMQPVSTTVGGNDCSHLVQ